MSSSVWPHRRQTTRLPCLWDSPGKNNGVSCHFLIQCKKVKSEKWKWSCLVVSTQRRHGLQPTSLLHPLDFPGKSTGVGCHCVLWKLCHMYLYICCVHGKRLVHGLPTLPSRTSPLGFWTFSWYCNKIGHLGTLEYEDYFAFDKNMYLLRSEGRLW